MNAVASSAAIGCSRYLCACGRYINVPFIKHYSFIWKRDKSELGKMPPMPEQETLPDLEQRILFALWKLQGIGKNTVEENRLRDEMKSDPPESVDTAVEALVNQGFLERNHGSDLRLLSLTPLGLAILRKLEEDRLQELK